MHPNARIPGLPFTVGQVFDFLKTIAPILITLIAIIVTIAESPEGQNSSDDPDAASAVSSDLGDAAPILSSVIGDVVNAPKTINPSWTLTPAGYGPLRFGDSTAEVNRKLSEYERPALKQGPLCKSGALGQVGVWVAKNNLTGLELGNGSTVKTDKGIGIGSSEAQLRRAYPKLTEQYGPGGYVQTYKPTRGANISFRVTQGKVDHIMAGVGNYSLYTGCS